MWNRCGKVRVIGREINEEAIAVVQVTDYSGLDLHSSSENGNKETHSACFPIGVTGLDVLGTVWGPGRLGKKNQK